MRRGVDGHVGSAPHWGTATGSRPVVAEAEPRDDGLQLDVAVGFCGQVLDGGRRRYLEFWCRRVCPAEHTHHVPRRSQVAQEEQRVVHHLQSRPTGIDVDEGLQGAHEAHLVRP